MRTITLRVGEPVEVRSEADTIQCRGMRGWVRTSELVPVPRDVLTRATT